MAYALGLGPSGSNPLEVQVLSWAPTELKEMSRSAALLALCEKLAGFTFIARPLKALKKNCTIIICLKLFKFKWEKSQKILFWC